METTSAEHRHLLEQLRQIARGLGETFAPFCEVVVHDLTDRKHAILAIHNNLSGRGVGDPVTELGDRRIANPDFPVLVANYPNRFPDGRQVKSTSIGIRDRQGKYVAALCLNVDLSVFRNFQSLLDRFGRTAEQEIEESLAPVGSRALLDHIDAFSARRATAPRALKANERRALLRELKEGGFLEMRRAIDTAARHLGVSRTTLYIDFRQIGG
ncbi:MAG: PAS domain-containing protein [Azoarcus sp.]|jgi:predicted transcriptional regulator YheO|nr:PAS domain-containing protein [Azoarcus sp.]